MDPKIKREKRIIRHKRVRAKLWGTTDRPRLSVFRSHKHMNLQLIDDLSRKTLIQVSTMGVKNIKGKQNLAAAAGKILAGKAHRAGIKEILFDRGGYKYHGRVRRVAEAIREAGIKV